MVTVKISETYDLSTKVDTMGIIGIHTPAISQVQKVWGNLLNSYKFMKFVGCDVTMACASMLPADPLQIGVESGKIAPQDMFNPILYKAVSNDSYNTLQARIMSADPIATGVYQGSLVREEYAENNAFNVYYGLLADPDGWRKAMPQSGLQMNGLYPIVYSVVNTYGNNVQDFIDEAISNPLDEIAGKDVSIEESTTKSYTFRGPSMRMPAIPTKSLVHTVVTEYSYDGVQLMDTFIPPTYVGCIITPPAKLNVLYYRLKVTWHIEFSGLMSKLEVGTMTDIASAGSATYGTDYTSQSSKMDALTSSVDVKDADVELIMTGTK
nr:MAG: capsid protein [Smacoviridae sp.]